MRLEYLDQALVLRAVLLQAFQLVARRTERARRRIAQAGDRLGGFFAGVDQVFGQRADDAVASRVHLADLVFVLARRLDHAARRCVDDGSDAAGLRIESVAFLPCLAFIDRTRAASQVCEQPLRNRRSVESSAAKQAVAYFIDAAGARKSCGTCGARAFAAGRPFRVVVDQLLGLRVIDVQALAHGSSLSSSRWIRSSPVTSSLPATFGGLKWT